MPDTTKHSTQRIYRGTGSHTVRAPQCEAFARGTTRIPTIADTVPVSWIMTRDVICAREDLQIDALMALVAEHRVGCVPVVDERGRPVGMVTKLDLVEHMLARADLGEQSVLLAGQLMMPLAITLDERATVAHAAAMMSIEGIHHVPIVSDGTLIGLVSTMDIVRWLAANDGFLASAGE